MGIQGNCASWIVVQDRLADVGLSAYSWNDCIETKTTGTYLLVNHDNVSSGLQGIKISVSTVVNLSPSLQPQIHRLQISRHRAAGDARSEMLASPTSAWICTIR